VSKIDADNDGNIDQAEFMTTLIDWGKVQKEQSWGSYLDRAFKKLDEDGDG
jgi:Ca2+-binding EF-hand superfamily protein